MGAEYGKGLTGNSGKSTADNHLTQYQPPQNQQYGTFQGVASVSQPPSNHTVVGIPPPAPPTTVPSPNYYPYGYQSGPGYVEVRHLREPELCCCIGLGWLLFIAGFFFAAIPWYIGALVLICGRVDNREKPGLVACMVASILAGIAVFFGVAGGTDYVW